MNFLSHKSAIVLVSIKPTTFTLTARIGNQDKGWALHICFNTCVTNYRSWVVKGYQFLVPYPWCEEWMEGNHVACNNDHVLLTALNINHNPREWRMFIHSLKLIKAVLLLNDKALLSVTVRNLDKVKLLLNWINYMKYQWQLCGDMQAVAIFLGLQQGYTKVCCLCDWDGCIKTFHYKKRDWLSQQSLEPGAKNVQHLPLLESATFWCLLCSSYLE